MIKAPDRGLTIVLAIFCAGAADDAFAGACGVTGTAAAPLTITYDPFGGAPLTQLQLPLLLTRLRGPGAERTDEVSFVLTMPPGASDYRITYAGTSILYTEGATMGRPQLPPHADGEVYYRFGGESQPDTMQLPSPIVVTIPANLDLAAGRPIDFDILYICKGADGMGDVLSPTRLAGAIHIDVNVLSGAQASYVGSLLDFGEVGNVTTTQVLAAPGAYSTPSTGNSVRVASSGPYRVDVASQNGFRLTFPGGNPADARQSLGYEMQFLGRRLVPTTPSFVPITCMRAGLGGIHLPVRARLLEGGKAEGESPKFGSPNYSDTVTVTISPLLDGASGQMDCAGIPLPAP